MNRFKTDIDGGLPLRLDDFRWLDDANRDTFKAVVKAMIGGATGAKLYGAEVVDTEQGDVFTCSDGWVYFNGEIYLVAAHNVVHANNVLYFREDVSYDAAGNKVFADTVSYDTYEIRRAVLESGASQPAGTLLYNARPASELMAEKMEIFTPWSSFAFSSLLITASSVGSLSNIGGHMAYKKLGKTMVCSINLMVDVAGWNAVSHYISVQLPSETAKADIVAPKSIIANDGSSGAANRLFKLTAVNGSGLRIYMLEDTPFPDGTYRFNGELTIELI